MGYMGKNGAETSEDTIEKNESIKNRELAMAKKEQAIALKELFTAIRVLFERIEREYLPFALYSVFVVALSCFSIGNVVLSSNINGYFKIFIMLIVMWTPLILLPDEIWERFRRVGVILQNILSILTTVLSYIHQHIITLIGKVKRENQPMQILMLIILVIVGIAAIVAIAMFIGDRKEVPEGMHVNIVGIEKNSTKILIHENNNSKNLTIEVIDIDGFPVEGAAVTGIIYDMHSSTFISTDKGGLGRIRLNTSAFNASDENYLKLLVRSNGSIDYQNDFSLKVVGN